MNLRQIKDKVEELCGDLQDHIPVEEVWPRIEDIRIDLIHSEQWIEKTAHLRLKVLEYLWDALLPSKSYEDMRWRVNQADGGLELAIAMDIEERQKGIPKPLKRYVHKTDGTEEWLETKVRDSEEAVTSKDVYDSYCGWMYEYILDSEPVSAMALGKRMTQAGFKRSTKRVDGKTERVWLVELL